MLHTTRPLSLERLLHLSACPRHTDRIVVTVVTAARPLKSTYHWLPIDRGRFATDQHLSFRTLFLDRMWVIYRRLQQLTSIGLKLGRLGRRRNLSSLLILGRDSLLLRWRVLQMMQITEYVLCHSTKVSLYPTNTLSHSLRLLSGSHHLTRILLRSSAIYC